LNDPDTDPEIVPLVQRVAHDTRCVDKEPLMGVMSSAKPARGLPTTAAQTTMTGKSHFEKNLLREMMFILVLPLSVSIQK